MFSVLQFRKRYLTLWFKSVVVWMALLSLLLSPSFCLAEEAPGASAPHKTKPQSKAEKGKERLRKARARAKRRRDKQLKKQRARRQAKRAKSKTQKNKSKAPRGVAGRKKPGDAQAHDEGKTKPRHGAKVPPNKPATRTPPRPRRRRPPLKPIPLGPEEQRLTQSLQLYLSTQAPYQSWTVSVQNTSSVPITLQKDLRLLWLRVDVPGKRRPTDCQLPSPLYPKSTSDAHWTTLDPGESFTLSFDPRFFCFDKGSQSKLIAGAKVTPHYGWETITRASWRHGHLAHIRWHQKPPYITQIPEPVALEPPPKPRSSKRQLSEKPPQGLRELVGNSILLDSDYQVWAKTKLKKPPVRAGLKLELTRGTDTYDAYDAAVSVTLRNNSQLTRYVYFHRERLSYKVYGPNGEFECGGDEVFRAPDQQGLSKLRPGASKTLTTWLREFCPQETFARPGYYFVMATFQGGQDKIDNGLPTFVGELTTPHARLLRIRTGEEPFIEQPPHNPDDDSQTGIPGPPPER